MGRTLTKKHKDDRNADAHDQLEKLASAVVVACESSDASRGDHFEIFADAESACRNCGGRSDLEFGGYKVNMLVHCLLIYSSSAVHQKCSASRQKRDRNRTSGQAARPERTCKDRRKRHVLMSHQIKSWGRELLDQTRELAV